MWIWFEKGFFNPELTYHIAHALNANIDLKTGQQEIEGTDDFIPMLIQ